MFEFDKDENELENNHGVTGEEPKVEKADNSEDDSQFVTFVFNPSDPDNPSLNFDGSYDPVKLADSAKEVISRMKQSKVNPQTINIFLQKACMAFGLPTTIASGLPDADDVLSLVDHAAKEIGGDIRKQSDNLGIQNDDDEI